MFELFKVRTDIWKVYFFLKIYELYSRKFKINAKRVFRKILLKKREEFLGVKCVYKKYRFLTVRSINRYFGLKCLISVHMFPIIRHHENGIFRHLYSRDNRTTVREKRGVDVHSHFLTTMYSYLHERKISVINLL